LDRPFPPDLDQLLLLACLLDRFAESGEGYFSPAHPTANVVRQKPCAIWD